MCFTAVAGNATVPGGVYSDLLANGLIDDILIEDNDVRTRWVAYDTWVYRAKFNGSYLYDIFYHSPDQLRLLLVIYLFSL